MEIKFNQNTNDSETKGLGAWYQIPDTNAPVATDKQSEKTDKK